MSVRQTVQFILDLGGSLREESHKTALVLGYLGDVAEDTGKLVKYHLAREVDAARQSMAGFGASAATAGRAVQTGLMAKLAGVKTSIVGLGDSLGTAAKELQQNQLLSTFETMASLLIQAGGPIAQFGIITASAARPVALFVKVLGGLPLALGAVAVAGGVALIAMKSLVNGALEAEERLRKLNIVTQQGASTELKAYTTATTALGIEMDKLKVTIGEGIAPTLTAISNAFLTGIVSLNSYASALADVNTKLGTLKSWTDTLSDIGLFIATGGTVHAAGAAINAVGSNPLDSFAAQNKNLDEATRKATQEAVDKGNKKAQQTADEQVYKDEIETAEDLRKVKEAQKQADEAAHQAFLKLAAEAIAMDNVWLENYNAKIKADQTLVQGREDAARAEQDAANERIHFELKRQEQAQALYEQQLVKEKAAHVAAQQQSLGAFGSAIGGGGMGGVLSAAGAGPVGAIVASINKDTPDMLADLFDQVLDLYTDLPEIIGDLAGNIAPELIRAAPEMAAAFAVIGPATAAALVASGPELFKSLIDAILGLPGAFKEAILGNFGTDLTASKGNKTFLGVRLPFFDTGSDGPLARGGLAVLHPGEEVLTAAQSRAMRSGGGGHTFNFHVMSPNARDLFRQIRESRGTYGNNETLAPYGI